MRVFDRLDKRFIEESKTKQNLRHMDRRISIDPQSYYCVFVFLDFSRKRCLGITGKPPCIRRPIFPLVRQLRIEP